MKTKYPREQDLIPHYDKHGYYYSPIGGKVGALFLEKSIDSTETVDGKVTMKAITGALEEYKRP